jgi:hypothetical protein
LLSFRRSRPKVFPPKITIPSNNSLRDNWIEGQLENSLSEWSAPSRDSDYQELFNHFPQPYTSVLRPRGGVYNPSEDTPAPSAYGSVLLKVFTLTKEEMYPENS